ncbi:MAG: domain S-box [Sporomusa sp.]|nr:domain S-box [Sporomusa sp.]
MNHWDQTVLFISNIFVTLAISSLGSCIMLTFPKSSTPLVWGVILGICSVLAMREGIFITNSSIVDFRHIILTMSGYIGGPIAAIVAASIGALFLWHLGGNGIIGDIISLYVFSAFGSLLRLYKPNFSKYAHNMWIKIGFLMALIYTGIQLGISLYYTGSIQVVHTTLLTLFILTPLGAWACFNFHRLIHEKIHRTELVECLLKSCPSAINGSDSPQNLLLASEDSTQNNLLTNILSSRGEARALHKELVYRQKSTSKQAFFSPTPLALYNLAEGYFIHVNESFIRHTGYSRQEIIAQPGMERAIWRFPSERERLLRLAYTEKFIHDFEFELITKSGDIRIGLLSAELIKHMGQHCLLTSVYDITERRNRELELARLDRLNLIGQMAASIGHEVRNPMTTVRGFLQLLAKKPALAGYYEYFTIMTDELDRANNIITEFLTLAKNKLIDLKSTQLNSIIHSVLPLMKADATTGHKEISLELSDIPNLALDEKEIQQLLLNLVRNALEASPAGGIVYIRTWYDVANTAVVLAVTDEGPGITPSVFKQLGTPFLTTKETGTGLGLPVCYSIAARHQATIDITTSTRGTTFFVRFKVSAAQLS